MKRTLVIHVRSWHLVLGLLLVVALSGGTAVAVAPSSFRPAGTFMVASNSSPDQQTVYATYVVVLSRAITVPAGKSADLFAFFNTEAECLNIEGGVTNVAVRLDSPTGTAFTPWPLTDFSTGYFALLSSQGFKYSVPAGPHTVYVTMTTTCPAGVSLGNRSLIITANIHD